MPVITAVELQWLTYVSL